MIDPLEGRTRFFNERITDVPEVTGITWFRSLFTKEAPEPKFPEGIRIYAIGDVHGCLDPLKRLEERIMLSARECDLKAGVIFLGDYIDRGPDVAGVVEHLSKGDFAGLPSRYLMGNHEDVLLESFADPSLVRDWLRWGGMATLASYRVALPHGVPPVERDQIISAAMQEAMPAHHHRFLDQLELQIKLGDYLFVHAGVRPRRSLAQQSKHDMLTIREPFLRSKKPTPWRVVHGHSVEFEAQILPFRIGIDTGAYATGRLSCAVIDADGVGVLSVEAGK